MAGKSGLGLLLAGAGALLILGGGKKKKKKKATSADPSTPAYQPADPSTPAYQPQDSEVIPSDPPPAPKKSSSTKPKVIQVNVGASDQMLSQYASDPSAFEDEYNAYSVDKITDVIYRNAQSQCPPKLNANDPSHKLCIAEWERIRAKVDDIASKTSTKIIDVNTTESNNWIGMFAADQELFGETYGLGRYASGDDVTHFIYEKSQPQCPSTLDKNNPAHARCIDEWLRIRDEVFRIISES